LKNPVSDGRGGTRPSRIRAKRSIFTAWRDDFHVVLGFFNGI
jgi:hypothetical protein